MKNKVLRTKKPSHIFRILVGVFQVFFFSALITAGNTSLANTPDLNVQNITGTVTSAEDGLPLIGVAVLIKGTSTGTVTDLDGRFEIEAQPDDILVFSYTGMQTIEVEVGAQSQIEIIMRTDSELLEEVVVIGYGTQKKSHLTGSVSKVENETLDQLAIGRVDDALVGQISGLTVAATEGEAGTAPTIRIRGTGSITGDSGPLIVLDGVVVDSDFLTNLDMNDIESFEVLKDAASAAIFGSRGANGVILITTKEGTEGPTQFAYNAYYGWKEAHQSDDYYFSVAETAAAELAATGSNSDRTIYKQLIGVDQDWQDIIFDGGNITNHALSARGGSEKTKFSLAFNYLSDEGVLLTDDFERYSARFKLSTKVSDKLTFGATVNPSFSDRRRFDGSTHDILRQTPWLPVYHDENTIQYVDRNVYPDVKVGDYAVQRHFDNYDLYGDGGEVDISNTSNTNPAAKVQERDYTYEKFKVFGSVYGQYKFNKNLSFRTAVSASIQDEDRRRWQGVEADRRGASRAQLDVWNINKTKFVLDNMFTYKVNVDRHDVSAILGMAAENGQFEGEQTRGTGYDSDLIQTLTAATTISLGESTEYENNLLSFFGRINYAYDDKYLVSLSYRRDGSSVFGTDNKYGDFPAIAVGWNAANESFLQDNDLISQLKLRFSYGVTGNNALDAGNVLIDNYPYINLLGTSTAVVNGQVVGGFNSLNIANPELQWERSVEFNPGIDIGIMNDRFTASLDYYKRTSDELLLFNPISSTTGFTNALVNIGEVENSGIEFELRTRNIVGRDFKWATTLIAARNKNELVDFAESNGQIQSVDSKRAAEWINLEGHPISSYYGWVMDEEIPLEFINNPYHPVGGTAQDVYVKDLNGDGLIDDDDKTILGDPYPDVVWSINNEFQISNFDFSFMFQGSHGAEIRNIGDQYLFNQFNSAQDYKSETPRQDFIRQKIFTSEQIMNASYVALRNVNLGYTLPERVLSQVNFLTSARVYVAAQNLLYITADDYTGFNPESINDTSPTTWGYQRAGSPVFQTISVGMNVQF